jgi:2-polyprenyl-3-methyl-5-hydroxy-6-metoxy-1,4-benzoquinol methylase
MGFRGEPNGNCPIIAHDLSAVWKRLAVMDKTTLERLVPDELLRDEATGVQTFRLHIERYEFASGKLRDANSILDIACGVGYGSRLLKDSLPGVLVTGIDSSAEAIDYANARYAGPGVTFRVGDAMTFDDGPFDAIVSLETIEHLPDPQRFIQRATTMLLRPGGIFIGSVPVTPSVDANPHHLHDFTARSFRKLLASCGLIEFDRLHQIQPYSPLAVITRTEERMRSMRPNIFAYYCRHPKKAILRLKSTLLDGFSNKYLTIAAYLPGLPKNTSASADAATGFSRARLAADQFRPLVC